MQDISWFSLPVRARVSAANHNDLQHKRINRIRHRIESHCRTKDCMENRQSNSLRCFRLQQQQHCLLSCLLRICTARTAAGWLLRRLLASAQNVLPVIPIYRTAALVYCSPSCQPRKCTARPAADCPAGPWCRPKMYCMYCQFFVLPPYCTAHLLACRADVLPIPKLAVQQALSVGPDVLPVLPMFVLPH